MDIHEIIKRTLSIPDLLHQMEYFKEYLNLVPNVKSPTTNRTFKTIGVEEYKGSWRIRLLKTDTGERCSCAIQLFEKKLKQGSWIPVYRMPKRTLEL